jgi:asparagine synthase (glutamine-hydrolysing)
MNQFERALQTMAHRGPEGCGVEVLPQVPFGKTVFIGHRRFAIVASSDAAHQPMRVDNWIITYDGEILNYKELRQGLEAKGFSFFSDSDTEVVLKSFIAYGPECMRAFRGMWAFAIWDESAKQLFLARDRFGIKPLFYFSNGEDFAFSSEIKALLLLDFVPKAPAIDGIKSFLLWGPPEYKSDTMFSGIKKLMPSHYLLFELESDGSLSDIKITKYYSIRDKIQPKNTGITFPEAVEQYRHHHRKAVEYNLVTDVPMGCALSGGLDSSSNVAVLKSLLEERSATNMREKLVTFSAVYLNQPDRSCDESVFINRLSNYLGVTNKQVEPTSDCYIANVEKFLWHQEEPTGGASVFAGWCVAECISRNGICVCLDGQGADEYLGGYHSFIGAFLVQNSFLFWKNWPFLFAGNNSLSLKKAIMYYSSHSFSKISKRRFFRELTEQFGLNSSVLEERLFFTEYKRVDDAIFDCLSTGLPTLLKFGERNHMAHSVESRPPFLDHKLVEFCLSLPTDYILRKGWTKYLARKAFESSLPREIVWRKDKMGFPAPEKAWVLEKNRFFEEVVRKSKIVKEINSKKVNWDSFSFNTRIKLFEIATWEKVFGL